ncbi:MAG TPA: hypothetical protein VF627_08955 [Abditibacterium sp.]|jgi:hypothetical protein
MNENWQAHPFRSGIIAGFVGLPLLWMGHETVLRWALGNPPLLADQIFVLGIIGGLPGAVLGAGLFTALDARRRGHRRAMKRTLLGSGGAVALVILLLFAVVVLNEERQFPAQSFVLGFEVPVWVNFYLVPLLTRVFPFHCAVLMFCVGLFMRARR